MVADVFDRSGAVNYPCLLAAFGGSLRQGA